MKKLRQNKGFTLAELLIVIAILAILIAIAIPSFGNSLTQSKWTTDHANIRSAYSIFKTAEMLGVIDKGDSHDPIEAGATYFFMEDGSIQIGTGSTTPDGAYELQVTAGAKDKRCNDSIGCKIQVNYEVAGESSSKKHSAGNHIKIVSDSNKKVRFELSK